MHCDVDASYDRAILRFNGLLEEPVAELPALRRENADLFGPIARLVGDAVAPYRPRYITPMAAVAGAVAQTILASLVTPDIARAFVNNGGGIALHLQPGQPLVSAIAGTSSLITVNHHDALRGNATSGWRGRSWSMGIADLVSVLARTAAMADAAATMIANAVDLPGHPSIVRQPACEVQFDSNLGARLVTVGEGCEAEHGALWHVPGGYAMRERLGESRAIVTSAMKVAGMGSGLDVPLGYINAAYVRSHFDAMTVSVPDAPRAAEIVFVLAMA